VVIIQGGLGFGCISVRIDVGVQMLEVILLLRYGVRGAKGPSLEFLTWSKMLMD